MEKNRQFERFAEIEIRDFNKELKTTIGNEFEIEFEYFKSLDQTQDDDSGKIRIFGLTKDRVESLQTEGGEVRFRCGYINSDIETLFVASIARLYANKENNTTVTTIECSANLLHYYFTGGVSANDGSIPTIVNLAGIYGKILGATGTIVELPKDPSISAETKVLLEKFVKTYLIKKTFVGSFETILRNFCDTFGMVFRREETEDGMFVAVFEVSLIGAVRMLKITQEGYVGDVPSPSVEANKNLFIRTLKEDDESLDITILNSETGLIDAKTEYKVATAYIDENLSKDDVETLKSRQKRANDAVRDNNREKIEAEKERKALAKGAKYERSDWKKQDTYKITRKYNRVKALLNPMVKPQSLVAVFESPEVPDEATVVGSDENKNTRVISNKKEITEGTYGKYRVRNATYKGNNKRGDWIMDLYCEDSDAYAASVDEIKELERTSSSEDFKTEGLEDLINEGEG